MIIHDLACLFIIGILYSVAKTSLWHEFCSYDVFLCVSVVYNLLKLLPSFPEFSLPVLIISIQMSYWLHIQLFLQFLALMLLSDSCFLYRPALPPFSPGEISRISALALLEAVVMLLGAGMCQHVMPCIRLTMFSGAGGPMPGTSCACVSSLRFNTQFCGRQFLSAI